MKISIWITDYKARTRVHGAIQNHRESEWLKYLDNGLQNFYPETYGQQVQKLILQSIKTTKSRRPWYCKLSIILIILFFSYNLYAQNFTTDEAIIGRLYKTIVDLQVRLDNMTKERDALRKELDLRLEDKK